MSGQAKTDSQGDAPHQQGGNAQPVVSHDLEAAKRQARQDPLLRRDR